MMRKHLLYLGLIAVLAFFATGCGGSDDAGSKDAPEAADEAGNVIGTANVKMDLGKTFEAEGLSTTLNHYLDNWTNPEDTYGFETADEGNKFIALNLTITNKSEGELEASQLHYTLDFGGTENAEHGYYGGTSKNIDRFESVTLAPGASTTGDFLFEVPAKSAAAGWTLVYNTDPFGFKKNYTPVRTPLGQ